MHLESCLRESGAVQWCEGVHKFIVSPWAARDSPRHLWLKPEARSDHCMSSLAVRDTAYSCLRLRVAKENLKTDTKAPLLKAAENALPPNVTAGPGQYIPNESVTHTHTLIPRSHAHVSLIRTVRGTHPGHPCRARVQWRSYTQTDTHRGADTQTHRHTDTHTQPLAPTPARTEATCTRRRSAMVTCT